MKEQHSASQRDPRWAAVLARDPGQDGRFVYSVRTTGVYCRPSCPSRRARPENVAFHADCAAAEAAGFRACKRCRPRQASVAEARAASMARICRLIEAAPEPPRLASLARQAGLSPFHFQRVFKATVGVSPRVYALAHRTRRVRSELRRGGTVTQAIVDAGFNSGGRFYETSNAVLGMTPRAFRAGGANTAIRFAVGDCSLGAVLVAQSDKGICAILLGEDPDALVRELQDRFPRAELLGGDTGFERCVAAVVKFVDAPATGLKLPLDVRGTVFQQRVWQALRGIPAGATASYADVARRIGAPQSARAVAQACAANALAVAIPCHRVVRTDGSLSGYRWGIERKRALLERESGTNAG
jgi:AraC family transcriptional regulator, regulatory protein of adaptative response / methylated-DNA-[protein]-cysteine methyltransferase